MTAGEGAEHSKQADFFARPIRRGPWIVFGLATFFAFPHEIPFAHGLGLPSVIDLGLLLTWVVPASLVVAVDGLAPRRAAKAAFVGSFLTHVAFFYWFLVVTVVYAGMPLFLGLLAPLVPALYVAPFSALFAWGWARFGGRGLRGALLGAALWVLVDWARGHLMGGFPWATLGYGLYLDWPLLGLTRIGGVYVLSFVAAFVGILLGQFFLAGRFGSQGDAGAAKADFGTTARNFLVAIAVVLALHGVGFALSMPDAQTRSVKVAAIQGNIDQGEKWEADRSSRILETYLSLSERAAEEGVDWIVWPETAVPGILENDAILRGRLADLATRHEVSLIVGGMGVEIDYEQRRFSAFFDSAFLLGPDGALEDRYDKTHLVPFGEFVPLRGLLGQFFQSLATGLSSSDVTPGDRPRNFSVILPGTGTGTEESGTEKRALVGVPICYELLFPDLVRRFGREGAGALLAITNDAWYGRTGAPHQFLAMTAMRAAENGIPVVRAANTGVSALIDARGRVQDRSPLFEEAYVVGTIEMPLVGDGSVGDRNPASTIYARFGDLFVFLCALGCVAELILQARARRSQHDGA